jgi:hypothetical protein
MSWRLPYPLAFRLTCSFAAGWPRHAARQNNAPGAAWTPPNASFCACCGRSNEMPEESGENRTLPKERSWHRLCILEGVRE